MVGGYQKLLLKILLLGFIVFGTLEAFYRLNPYKKEEIEYNYNASIIEKHTRLKSLHSPKFVFVSGSSFAYGLNSEEVEKALKKPVVNMAIHFEFGTDYMLRQIENELKAGDTVVMGFEYMIKSEGNANQKYVTAKFYPESKEWFNYYSFPECLVEPINIRISALRINLIKWLNHDNSHPSVDDSTSIFFRKAINKYGDLVSHLNNPPLSHIPLSTINKETDLKEPLEDMNDFASKMRQKGVRVIYVYPPYASSSYEKDKELIVNFERQFHRNNQFDILGSPQDFVYPDSLCQDSPYHLNVKGREIHTQKLISLLAQTQKNN